MNDEEALWAAIDAMPECQLRRGVLADFLDERAGFVKVECPRCKGTLEADTFVWVGSYPASAPMRKEPIGKQPCFLCENEWQEPTGLVYIPDGRADLAMALRATATYIPHAIGSGDSERWWYDRRNYDDDIPADEVPDHLPGDLFDAIQTDCEYIDSDMCIAFKRFPTASAAIMALGRAWIAVHCKSEVPS